VLVGKPDQLQSLATFIQRAKSKRAKLIADAFSEQLVIGHVEAFIALGIFAVSDSHALKVVVIQHLATGLTLGVGVGEIMVSCHPLTHRISLF